MPLALVFATTWLSFGQGCDSRPVDWDVPLVEPASPDMPNISARAEWAKRQNDQTDGQQDWPGIYGPNQTSRIENQINPVWDDDGPPILWQHPVGTGYGSPVAAARKVVYQHRIEDEQVVECRDLISGELIWEYRDPTQRECEVEYSNGPYSTPLIHSSGDRVYVVSGEGEMAALDFGSGDLLWRRDLLGDYSVEPDLFPVGASPVLVADRLIFNLGAEDEEAGIVALDSDTGETVWQATDHGPGYCRPLYRSIEGQEYVFVMTSRGLVCLNPSDGKVDWEYPHFSRSPMSYNAISPIALDDLVLMMTGPGPGAICLRMRPDRSFEDVWKSRRVLDCQYTALIQQGEHFLGFTHSGQGGAELRCIDFRTGQLKWRYHSILKRGQGLMAGDTLVVQGERGHLAALRITEDAEEPIVLSFTKDPVMSEPSYCPPALSDGVLLLKDEERVVAFDVR